MAKLKAVKLKDKNFVFKAYGNAEEKQPAKITFSRFPHEKYEYAPTGRKDLFDGVDVKNATEQELRSAVSEKIVENFTNNIVLGEADYRLFFMECVDSIHDFEYERSKITTPNDFWQILPLDAANTIAKEAYEYATEKDEFTMGESSA